MTCRRPLRQVSREAGGRGSFREHLIAQGRPRGHLNQAAQDLGTQRPSPETPWPKASPVTPALTVPRWGRGHSPL